jgi:hypothetical protein
MPYEFKGTVFSKRQMVTGLGRKNYKVLCLYIFLNIALCEKKNGLTVKKVLKIVLNQYMHLPKAYLIAILL